MAASASDSGSASACDSDSDSDSSGKPAGIILQSKPVQEISLQSTKEVPHEYIHKNGYPQASEDFLPWMDTLLIDLSLLSSSSSPAAAVSELDKLHSALTSWGCFQVINHGMTSSFLDEVRQVTKQFFALPLEEKQKHSRTVDDIDGYGNDTIVYEHQTLDWGDRLYLTIYPLDKYRPNLWPEIPPRFREVIHQYTTNLKVMLEVVLKAVARAMKLEEHVFLKGHGEEGEMTLRFNLYPCCPTPERVLGVKPHGDTSTITILLQDKDVEGLQVLKDGKWFKVPIIHDTAIFINVGDMAEIMSNGIIKSAVHRVVTNSISERISLAVFCGPHPDTEVGPLDELINTEHPPLYRKVKNYGNLFFKYYQLGERTINAFKI